MKPISSKAPLPPAAPKLEKHFHKFLKARQAAKIKQLGEALVAAGFGTLA